MKRAKSSQVVMVDAWRPRVQLLLLPESPFDATHVP